MSAVSVSTSGLCGGSTFARHEVGTGRALPRVGTLMERGLRWLRVAYHFEPRTKVILNAGRPVS